MQFDAVLRTFSEFFEREGIRYCVVGGLAVQAWGHSRFTKDVDLAVARSDQARVIAFAESAGYETLNVTSSFSNHLHPDRQFGRLDFLYPDDRTAGRMFAVASVRTVVGTVAIPVASPEHLSMMKALAIKQNPARALYEGDDVRALLSLPGVDLEAAGTTSRRSACWSSSMSSEKRVEVLDFESALPMTEADVAALEAVRKLNYMPPQEYLEFLLAFAPMHPPDRRINRPEDTAFELD